MSEEIVSKAEVFVKKSIKVTLTQNEFDALVIFTYNAGGAGFDGSSLKKLVNSRNFNKYAIAQAFGKWNKGRVDKKLVVLPGLTKRRKQEAQIFISSNYDSTH